MGFFNFFKRDISEEEFQEQQKVKRGLEKTRTGFFQRIVNTLTNAQIDDDLYDQLEEQLILADVGPACAVRLVDELHDEVEEKHLKTGQEALDALRGIICQELTPRYPMDLDGKPAVILVIGVNGVGKTTTIAKLAGLYKKQGRRAAYDFIRHRDAAQSVGVGCQPADQRPDAGLFRGRHPAAAAEGAGHAAGFQRGAGAFHVRHHSSTYPFQSMNLAFLSASRISGTAAHWMISPGSPTARDVNTVSAAGTGKPKTCPARRSTRDFSPRPASCASRRAGRAGIRNRL